MYLEYLKDYLHFCLEFLLEIDSCFVVMSAQRILSNAERQLIRNGLQDAPREYLLTNFIDLEEEDQAEVLNLLKKFDPSREIMPIDNQDNVDALKNHWTTSTPDVKKLSNLREEAAIRYARAKLTAHLTERRAVCEIAKKNAAPLIRDLSYVPQDIPSKQRDTTFLLKRFSDRIKMDTQTELDNFELKMREDLKVGIEEENNIEDLRQTLPAFVGGSWQEFVSDTLMHKMIDRENELMTLLEKDISDKIDEILKMRLTAENYIKINSIIDAEIRRIPEGLLVDKASGGSWNDMEFRLSHVKNKNSVRGLMSGVLVAAGGFAVMSSIFLPGMALMLISYKMHKNNSNEQKAQLLEGALEFSKRHYLSLTAELEQAFKSASTLVEERIAKCYEKIFELLTNVLEEYKENVSQLEAELVELERDCENLSVDK